MSLKCTLSSTNPPRVLTRAAMSHRPRSPRGAACQSGAHRTQSPHLPIQRPRFHLPLRFARLLRRARISRRISRAAMADDGGSVTAAPEKSPGALRSPTADDRGSVSPAPAPEKSPENLHSAVGGSSPPSSSSAESVSEISSGCRSGINRLFGRKETIHSVLGSGMRTDSSIC